jgi:predicted porin
MMKNKKQINHIKTARGSHQSVPANLGFGDSDASHLSGLHHYEKTNPRLQSLAASFMLATTTLCAVAEAETDLTLYGRAVVGVGYQSNIAQADGRSESVRQGIGNQWGTSMLGLRGSEDLGSGTSVLFALESGFRANDGIGHDNFLNRRAYLGLSGRFGTLKIGRDLFISNDIGAIDPTAQQAMGTATLVHGCNWHGAKGIIEYTLPTWHGLTAKVQTSFGGQFGAFKKNRQDGVSIAYQYDNFEFRAIYDTERDLNGRYSNVFETSRELILGGTATFDRLKLFVGYENLNAPDVAAGAPDRVQHYWIGTNYTVNPVVTLIGAAYRVNVNRAGGSANLFVLGANYYLSKQTTLYASVGTVRNSTNANFPVETAAHPRSPFPGQYQNGAYAGVSYAF